MIDELPTTIPQCGGDIDDAITVNAPNGSTPHDHLECMQDLSTLIGRLESLFNLLGSA